MDTFKNTASPPPAVGDSSSPPERWNATSVSAYVQAGGIPASLSTLKRKVAAGLFPQPLRFGSKCTLWNADEVRYWVATGGRIGE